MVAKKPEGDEPAEEAVPPPRIRSAALQPNSTLASRAAAAGKRVSTAENKAVRPDEIDTK
jgi:hypothetical protein